MNKHKTKTKYSEKKLEKKNKKGNRIYSEHIKDTVLKYFGDQPTFEDMCSLLNEKTDLEKKYSRLKSEYKIIREIAERKDKDIHFLKLHAQKLNKKIEYLEDGGSYSESSLDSSSGTDSPIFTECTEQK